MGSPYIGEIRLFAGSYAPAGWAFCDGSLMAISENEALFQLLGTTYGGDGQNSFALPDMRGRVPIHQGSNAGNTYVMAQTGGAETVTLTPQQMPNHTHAALATSTGQTLSPQNALFASVTSSQVGANAYATAPTTTGLVPASIGSTGGNQPHENMQPTLFVSFIISLYGIYPSPT